jgi:hypothetical protein
VLQLHAASSCTPHQHVWTPPHISTPPPPPPPPAGDTLIRKFGRAEAIQKQSVPELVFAYFNNKYGQRALVDENIGSLVNTLTLHKRADLRLEAFARCGCQPRAPACVRPRRSARPLGRGKGW